MNNERVAQIKAKLNGLGTKTGELYTKQEVVDLLREFQNALLQGVYEKTHAEHLGYQDLTRYFESTAAQYHFSSNLQYLQFMVDLGKLSCTIGTNTAGLKGEQVARRSLSCLATDKRVKILYNVQLEDGDVQAEYDAIVIAPYGLFVVEVKNWNSPVTITPDGQLVRDDNSNIVYDLAWKMGAKQALLRKFLADDFPKHYQDVLIFPNEKTKVDDHFGRIKVIRGGGAALWIPQWGSRDEFLSDEQISAAEQKILSHHKVQKAPSPVNCEAIIDSYAVWMDYIEDKSADAAAQEAEQEVVETPVDECPEPEHIEPRWYERVDWWDVAGSVLSGVSAAAIAYGLMYRKKH